MNGDVTFIWTVSTNETSPLFRIKYNYYWIDLNNTRYTVKDVYLYTSITIDVTERVSNEYARWTYTVGKVQTQHGSTVTMEWPNLIKASGFHIYHTLGETRAIIQIEKSKVKYEETENKSKYAVNKDPNTSTCINVEIKNITLDDAGFYSVEKTDDESSLDRGFFLVVTAKPVSPKIKRNIRVHVKNYVELMCSSQSTSAPDYYSKLVTLSYTWFVNGTKMGRETREILSLYVTRDLKYNRYSCSATEEGLESDRSVQVQINHLCKYFNVFLESVNEAHK
ncbi:uncharacterized protein LOC128174890 [Crassostrea angulata]|uniref:uncharacterized protein LOC128174890 n=1 Tax=Magallana angulata TaxID=2784310 RepID=UPI0022B0EE10|nr:uncharacterized protein LOC128174890 [Crassostrea angulata]